MTLQPLTRHQNGLLTRALFLSKCTSASPPTRRIPYQCRQAHSVPRLALYQTTFEKNGIPGLYTPEGFQVSWTDQMLHTVNKLNDILARGPGDLANSSTKDILLQTARSPSNAHLFNYASMAHNTHFYFSSLCPNTKALPDDLQEPISRCFSSLTTLKDTMLTTADAMFGPGFVWLCQVNNIPGNERNSSETQRPINKNPQAAGGGHMTKNRNFVKPLDFRLLTTYLAGSPYPGAHSRQQGRDLNIENLRSTTDWYRHNTLQNSPGSFGNSSQGSMGVIGGDGEDARRYGGAEVVPILCVNTWEHAWLFDWGVGGKSRFLEKWWDRIDWDVVASRIEWRATSRDPTTRGLNMPNYSQPQGMAFGARSA